MTRTIIDHEITTEHKLIRVITRKYITDDEGVEHTLPPHRAPNYVPGTLNGDAYTKTSMKDLPDTVRFLAGRFWTQEVHDLFEALLKEQAAVELTQ